MDAVSRLLRGTVLREGNLARAVFKFAISHSSNALSPKATKRQRNEPIPVEWIFDWLSDLAYELSSPLAWKVKVADGNLWITRQFCINLDILGVSHPELVRQVLDQYDPKVAYPLSEELVGTLQEMNLVGHLFFHILHDASFASPTTFNTRKEFIRYLFEHARRNDKPLIVMELLYESAVYSWSMKFDKFGVFSSEPWNQTWREYADRFGPVQGEIATLSTHALTFRGQRHFAFDFFEKGNKTTEALAHLNGGPGVIMDKASFKGAWVVAFGRNRHIRKRLLASIDLSNVCDLPWTSFLLPWADHTLFVDYATQSLKSESPERTKKIHKLLRFIVVAAVIDKAPEALDCPLHVWMQSRSNEARFLELKPQFRHVLCNIKRLTKTTSPPTRVACTILNAVETFIEQQGSLGTFWPERDVMTSFEVRPYDFEKLMEELRGDACIESIDSLALFDEAHKSQVLVMFVLSEGSNVTWLDLTFSRDKMWIPERSEQADIMIARTSRECFVIATHHALRGAACPKVFRHPLSLLNTSEYVAHPLWSAGLHMLELCV